MEVGVVEVSSGNVEFFAVSHNRFAGLELLELHIDTGFAQCLEGVLDALVANHGAHVTEPAAGESSGPLEVDRPWESFADDQLGLMDHLGIDKFMVLGFCIGGLFIWNLVKRAPNRVVAGVLAQPVGFRPEMPTLLYDGSMTGWGPALVKRRPDITMATIERFLTAMYRTNPDFVFTVTRDFVRTCQTPVLVLPDDVPAHPYAVAMETVMLAPKAEVSMYPWKEPKERIPLAVRQIRSFLRAHRLASA